MRRFKQRVPRRLAHAHPYESFGQLGHCALGRCWGRDGDSNGRSQQAAQDHASCGIGSSSLCHVDFLWIEGSGQGWSEVAALLQPALSDIHYAFDCQ